jgi:hypothetical protein
MRLNKAISLSNQKALQTPACTDSSTVALQYTGTEQIWARTAFLIGAAPIGVNLGL